MATVNYNFISQPDPNFTCSICLELSSQPKQCEDCGKVFCSECIEKNGSKPCPNCRAKSPRYFKDVKSGRDIKELGVRCANVERGCPWTGTIGTLDTHLATCEFVLVPCPNKCGYEKDAGEKQVMKKDLDDHLVKKCLKRPFQCQYCGEKGTYASITGDHDKVCDKKMVACPNWRSGCRKFMKRGETEQHMSVCGYTKVACAYESLGCKVRMLRKNIIRHQENDNKKHLLLMMKNYCLLSMQHKKLLEQSKIQSEQLQSLSEQVRSQSEQVRLLSEQQHTLSEGEALVFKLSGYASKKEKHEVFHSPSFYTHFGGYKMCIRIYPNGIGDGLGLYLSVFAKVLESSSDDQLHWPFLGIVKYELLNQLADERHYAMLSTFTATDDMQVSSSSSRSHPMLVGTSSGCPKFLPHSSLCHDPATNSQYLLDDALYFRVSVKVDNHKPWLVCADKINVDSTRAIKNYKTLQDGQPFIFKVTAKGAADNHFVSDAFYTSPSGFKMCFSIHPNGCGLGEGTHVSVHTRLSEGSYDASLSWPFLGTVAFTLLNQLSDENHYENILKFENIDNVFVGKSLGFDKFIPQSALCHDPVKNTQYLKNDTLYFRVSVKDDIHKPWLICT